MVDHHVDRPEVNAQQCVQLTGPNRSIGLISPVPRAAPRPAQTLAPLQTQPTTSGLVGRPGDHSEGPNTRSHSELGREIPQRRWYCVSRRGRVGRRQVFPPDHNTHHTLFTTQPHTPTTAGWSSPVARQAHNLKVAGSNPAPATTFSITSSPPAVQRNPRCTASRLLNRQRPQITSAQPPRRAHA